MDKSEVEKLVDQFPGQSIDFFGALRARVYDDRVRQFVLDTGIENIGKALVNACAPCPCRTACLSAQPANLGVQPWHWGTHAGA